jgi:poly(3-hydroxyalkanoate) depolymerase
MTELVEVDGIRLRVSIEGHGRPLLLLNGIGASLELLEPFRRALHATETIAVDMPGAGGSATPLLPRSMARLADLASALLDVLGYREVDVLGISWGGALAQELALRHPRRVRRVTLAATSAGWLAVPGRPSALWVLATPRRYYSPSYLERVAGTLYGGAVRDDPQLFRAQKHFRFIHPPSLRGYLWQLAAGLCWTSLFRLHRLTQPTLVLGADDDPIIPLANARLLAWRLPNARLHVVARGGHLFLITHAAAVAPLIEEFLTSNDLSSLKPRLDRKARDVIVRGC